MSADSRGFILLAVLLTFAVVAALLGILQAHLHLNLGVARQSLERLRVDQALDRLRLIALSDHEPPSAPEENLQVSTAQTGGQPLAIDTVLIATHETSELRTSKTALISATQPARPLFNWTFAAESFAKLADCLAVTPRAIQGSFIHSQTTCDVSEGTYTESTLLSANVLADRLTVRCDGSSDTILAATGAIHIQSLHLSCGQSPCKCAIAIVAAGDMTVRKVSLGSSPFDEELGNGVPAALTLRSEHGAVRIAAADHLHFCSGGTETSAPDDSVAANAQSGSGLSIGKIKSDFPTAYGCPIDRYPPVWVQRKLLGVW